MSSCEGEGELTFINAVITGRESDTTALALPAQTQVQSALGDIVAAPSCDYYVSIQRLRVVLEIPLAIAPIGPTFASDGVTTAWSLTVRYTDAGGTVYDGRAYLKVQPRTVIAGQTTQPRDLYMAIWTLSDWMDILNVAVAAAYAAADTAAGGGVLPTQVPFFSLASAGSGRLLLTLYPFDLWNLGSQALGKARLELYCNWAAFPAFGGWDLIQRTFDNEALSPTGCDYKFAIRSTGYNYDPQPAVGSQALIPAGGAPATSNLVIDMTSPCYTLPGIVKVSFLSSLSTVPEFVGGGSGRETSLILTDQSPDLSKITLGDNRTAFYYNTGVKDARWVRMLGSGSVQNLTVRVTLRDYFGHEVPYLLRNLSQAIDIKLAVAPRRIVDNYR